jgi:hypothetical protein
MLQLVGTMYCTVLRHTNRRDEQDAYTVARTEAGESVISALEDRLVRVNAAAAEVTLMLCVLSLPLPLLVLLELQLLSTLMLLLQLLLVLLVTPLLTLLLQYRSITTSIACSIAQLTTLVAV